MPKEGKMPEEGLETQSFEWISPSELELRFGRLFGVRVGRTWFADEPSKFVNEGDSGEAIRRSDARLSQRCTMP